MSQKNVFPTGSSVLDRYVISTRGTAQFGDNSNNYLVGVAPTTYNTYQVATVGNINNFGLTPQNNTGSSTGTYYSNSVSAMRIPADSSANRPPTGYPGYIRYNTDSSLIEYWSGVSNSWQFVSQQPPTITTVTPTYVSDVSEITDVTAPGADLNASNVINITGTNFVATPTITFIDSAGLRTSSGNVLYQSSTNLITTFPIALLTVSAEILGPYSLLLTNVSSNLSVIKTNCITVNLQPYWVPGNSITQRSNIPVTGTYTSPITGSTTQYDGGTVLSNSASAKCTAVDPEGTTVTYTLTNDTSSNLINSGLTFQSTGYLNGTVAKLNAASSFNFSVDAYDASGVHTSIGYFTLQINRHSPLIAFSSLSGLSVTTGYVDSNGLNYRTTVPYNTTPPGYTIYLIQCSTTSSGGTTGTGTITYPSVCPSYLTYIIVGGGGGGGGNQAGSGGGAGGLLMNSLFSITANGTASIQVGAGGTRAPEPSINNAGGANGGTGANSFLGSNIAYGGAGGRTMDATSITTTIVNGVSGGNGCGASSWQAYGILATGGAGTNSLTISSQGNYGGNANNINGTSGHTSGGGGGYAGPGTNDVPRPVGGTSITSFTIMNSGNGGNGLTTNLSGSQLIVAGGGGGGCYYGTAGNGGVGGGGAGISNTSTAGSAGSPATDRNGAANTGGGGGGGGLYAGTYSGYGGTGIMILRHVSYITTPTLNTYTITYGTGTNTVQTIYLTNAGAVTGSAQTNGYTVLVFTSDGTTYPGCSFTFTPTTSIGPNVSYLLCGAGGSGGQGSGGGAGGGGGGGVLIGSHYPVTINTTYNINVGVGGRAISGPGPGNNTSTNQQGGNSTFNNIIAYGGGGSGSGTNNGASGGPSPGGCGGGGGEWPNLYGASGTIGQGYEGGTTVGLGQAAGGGGAGGPGSYTTSSVVGAGGDGIPSFITGTLAYYGGGGGASGNSLAGSLGGLCGATSPYNQGGHGGAGSTGGSGTPTSGTQYYGGGGGGTYQVGAGTLIGGSGTVILRFPSYTMS